MTEQDQPTTRDHEQQEKRIAGWVRFYAGLYRIILVAGLLTLVASVVLLIATDLLTVWILLLPTALIAFGIFLARVEYRLDMRLYNLHNQEPSNGGN